MTVMPPQLRPTTNVPASPAGGQAEVRYDARGTLISRRTEARVAQGQWPPELPEPEHHCELRAVVRQSGDDWSSTGYYYNRAPDGLPSLHHGSRAIDELADNLAALPREERDNVEVGIMRTPSMQVPPLGNGPLRGDEGVRALRELAGRMREEETTNTIDRSCNPLISMDRPTGPQLALQTPASPGALRARFGR